MPSRIILVTLLLGLLVQPVTAKDTTIGPVTINLVPPEGYCELEPGQPSDARMIKAVEGMLAPVGNRLLGMSASCTQLTDWRTGKRPLLDNISQFQTIVRLEASELPTAPAETVATACNEMRAQGDKLVADMTPDVKARAEQIMQKVKINEMQFMGVVAQDPLVCYAALLQKFRAETGVDKTQVNLFATTVIKGKIVYYYLMAPYVSGATVEEMLARHKVNVDRLHAANRN
jgi:hypothetical protein